MSAFGGGGQSEAMGPVRIVCFDLGGVLVRICRSWEEACARAGIDVREGYRDSAHEGDRRRIVELYEVGGVRTNEYYKRISHSIGGLYEPEEVRRVHLAWLIEEYSGARDVLASIRSAGRAKTACLSNTNEDHWELMESWGALSLLDHAHASHLLGARKPDDACFVRFEEAVGAHGEGVLFFDDLAANIEAARSRGWRAELIDHTGDTAAQLVEHLCRHSVIERSD